MEQWKYLLERIRLDRTKINTPPGGDADKIIRMCYKRVEDVIVEYAKSGGWIPVWRCLPEDGGTVLCTDGHSIYLVEYEADSDAAFGDIDGITAWMPLPEPYRAVESDGEEGDEFGL